MCEDTLTDSLFAVVCGLCCCALCFSPPPAEEKPVQSSPQMKKVTIKSPETDKEFNKDNYNYYNLSHESKDKQ
jgi:hypothetical protein